MHQMMKPELKHFRSILKTALDRVQFGDRFARHAEFGITAGRTKLPLKIHKPVLSKKLAGLWEFQFEILSAVTDRRYRRRSSSSLSRCSNKRSVLSIGAGDAMSTPAACKVSSGNFDPPEHRKFRYASTLPGAPESTRCESATAAEMPVAYL